MQLLVLLFCAAHLSSGAPQPSPFLSWFTSNSSDRILSYLPKSAEEFVNNTLEDGKDVVYDMYEDVKEEIINKTADNVGSLTEVVGRMFDNFYKISNSVSQIFMEDKSEIDIDDLNSLKTELNMLEEKVRVDMENDKYVTEDVEKLIQQFLTSTREMVAELGKNGEKFWKKMKQLEVEFYRIKMALADGSGELKKEVSALFNTLRMVDLNMIGAMEDKDSQDNSQGIPRQL